MDKKESDERKEKSQMRKGRGERNLTEMREIKKEGEIDRREKGRSGFRFRER